VHFGAFLLRLEYLRLERLGLQSTDREKLEPNFGNVRRRESDTNWPNIHYQPASFIEKLEPEAMPINDSSLAAYRARTRHLRRFFPARTRR